MLLPCRVGRGFEHKVGVLQRVGNLGRHPGHLAEGGEQLFFGRGEGVGFLAQQVLQCKAVVRQARVLRHGAQGGFGQGEHLRLGEGERRHGRGVFGRDARVHALGRLGAGVFAVAH